MRKPLRNVSLLLRAAYILARHDALFLIERLGVTPAVVLAARLFRSRHMQGRPGQRLASALSKMGPAFIKLGQALATRSDLLGDEIAADLTQLQDRLPPFPMADVRRTLETEFDLPLDQMFASFETTPVAAASIAQVHFAVTSDGREVAVKVLRPKIAEAFARDLDMFLWVAGMVEATRPDLRRLKPLESVRTFEETVRFEMDLRFEAAAAVELGKNFADDSDIHIPEVDWSRTDQRVLTTERVSGIRYDHRDAIIAAGHDPEACVLKSAKAFFQMVFRDGFFHGDLHPGNMFVRADGTIAIVDFGIMGRLDRVTRRYLAEMLHGFISRDYRRAAEVHFEAGWVAADKSVDAFTQACRSIAEPILGLPQAEISIARLLAHLFRVTEYFQMETQPQLLLLQKTMLVAEGASRRLHPHTNMWLFAEPLVEDWVADNLGPQAKIRDAADALLRIPKTLTGFERTVNSVVHSGLRLNDDTLAALKGGPNRRVPLSTWIALLLAGALLVVLMS